MPCGQVAAPLRGACCLELPGTPGLVERKNRRGYEDGAVGPCDDTDEKGEGEVAQGRFPEDQQRRYRDQGEDRGVDRTPHDLADGAVYHLVEAAPVVADSRGVLPDPVEDDYGVVDRVPEHREHSDDGYQADLPAYDGVETYRHKNVVNERGHRSEGEGELESKADKGHDYEQRGHHGLQRLVPELLAERGAHGRDAYLPPERPAQGVAYLALLLLRAYDRSPHLVAVLPHGRDDGFPREVLRQRSAHLFVAEVALGVGNGELRSALEVYPEVEAAQRYGDYPCKQQYGREREIQLPATDEVYFLEHAYFTLACCAAEMLALETPIMAGERWMPRSESNPRSARVITMAVNIESTTPMASRTAKPLTDPLESANRMNAVMRVVMLPSRIAL